jgi:hypothetical protein
MGVKPDDFYTYPLTWSAHHDFHQRGQPTHDQQAVWVGKAWRLAVRRRLLVGATGELFSLNFRETPSQSAQRVREMFDEELLRLNAPYRVIEF